MYNVCTTKEKGVIFAFHDVIKCFKTNMFHLTDDVVKLLCFAAKSEIER